MTASEALATYAGEIDTLAGTLNARRTYFDQDASVARQKLNIVLASSGSARMDADVQLGLDYVAQIDKMSVGIGTLAGALTAFASYIRETVIPEFAEPERIAAGGAVGVFYEEIAPMGYSGYETNEAAWLAWANDKIAALEEKWRVETGPAEAAKLVAAAADIDAAYLVNVTDNRSFSAPVVTEGASGLMLQLFKEAGLDPIYTLTDLTPAEASAAVVDLRAAQATFAITGNVDALAGLLSAHYDDPVVMARLLEQLGPDVYYKLIGQLGDAMVETGDASEVLLRAAEDLRAGLEFAIVVDTFINGGLANAVATSFETSVTSGEFVLDPYRQIGFILDSPFLPEGFDVALLEHLVGFEIDNGVRFANTNPQTFQYETFNNSLPTDGDVVAFLLDRVGGDPAAARQVYSDPARTTYLVGERDYLDPSTGEENLTPMFESLQAASVPSNLDDPDAEPTSEDIVESNAITTVAVAALGDRDGFDPSSLDADASVAAAAIVTAHMNAVEFANSNNVPPIDPTAYSSLDDVPSAGDSKIWMEDDGERIAVAVLDQQGLDLLVRSAGSTDAGFVALREGTAEYRAWTSANAAQQVAEMDTSGVGGWTNANAVLTEYADEAARVESYLFGQVFDENVTEAEERDSRARYWIDRIESGVDLVGTKIGGKIPGWGQVIGPIVDQATDLGSNVAEDNFASNTEEAVAGATDFFQQLGDGITHTFIEAMVEEGVITPPAGVTVNPDGTIDWSSIATVTWMDRLAADGVDGNSVLIDTDWANDASKLEQLPEWLRNRGAGG